MILIILCDFSQQSYCSLNEKFHSEKFGWPWYTYGSLCCSVAFYTFIKISKFSKKTLPLCGSKIMSVLFPYLCICTFSTRSIHQNVLWIHFFLRGGTLQEIPFSLTITLEQHPSRRRRWSGFGGSIPRQRPLSNTCKNQSTSSNGGLPTICILVTRCN